MHTQQSSRRQDPAAPEPTAVPRCPLHQLQCLQRLVGNAAVTFAVQRHAHSAAAPLTLQRDALPGYAQRGDTCQPASLLTAFLVWDRERASPGAPNGTMLSACDAVLINLNARRAQLVLDLGTGGRNGATELAGIVGTVERTQTALRAPGATVSEAQFQELATALSRVFDQTADALRAMGIAVNEHGYDSLGAIFGSPELTGLTPGQIAQIEWYVNQRVAGGGTTLGYHAFLIGRKADGVWFLSDQGNSPPLLLRAPSLGALRTALDAAAASGASWLDTRPTTRRQLLTWTGVRVLSAPQEIEPQHRTLLPPGQQLGVVNPGRLRYDIPMLTWDWIGLATSLLGARGLFGSAGHGHGFVIGDYTGPNYLQFNPFFRGSTVHTPEEAAALTARVEAISEALAKLPPYRGEVLRGARLAEDILEKYEPGKRIVEKAFTSATRSDQPFLGNTEFIITSETGRDISQYSQIPEEQEVLFDRGTTFLVLTHDVIDDFHYIQLKEVTSEHPIL